MGRFTRIATQPRRVPPPPTKACSTPTNAALQAVGDLSISSVREGLTMAYLDRTLARDIVLTVRLNEEESDLLDSIVRFTGQQKSALLREMFLEGARKVLMGEADIGTSEVAMEATQSMRVATR
jgi:hypothetical protein